MKKYKLVIMNSTAIRRLAAVRPSHWAAEASRPDRGAALALADGRSATTRLVRVRWQGEARADRGELFRCRQAGRQRTQSPARAASTRRGPERASPKSKAAQPTAKPSRAPRPGRRG